MMERAAKVLHFIDSEEKTAEVEIVDIRPWGYKIVTRVTAHLPVPLGLKQGDIVEIKLAQPGFIVVRRSILPIFAIMAAVFSICALLYFAFFAEKTPLSALEVLFIPFSWSAVAFGKLASLKRYMRRLN